MSLKKPYALLLCALAGTAAAQLRLPTLPNLPGGLNRAGELLPRTEQALRRADQTLAPLDLAGLRQRLTDRLLLQHPRELARDPAGEAILAGELLALPSSAAARAALLAEPGLRLEREQALDGLGLAWLTLRAAEGQSLPALLARLRALDPEGQYDYHHLYTGSGAVGAGSGATGAAVAASAAPARVGLIDSGVDASHPALRGASVRHHGCEGQVLPAQHGTAVASLLVGRDDDFGGALPGATLYAADAYCEGSGRPGGGVQAIAAGLAWLAREQVGVINISLVGPPNALLKLAIAAAQARGHLIVAAVGNDGPAAPPLYPASWPGVVGVTALDGKRRALAEAGRGPQVALAAPGSEMAAAAAGDRGYLPVRGTSFAAPLVAGLLAAQLPRPDREQAAAALSALSRRALDLGAPGRDDIYGSGLVGEPLRVAPQGLRLARPR